MSSIIQVFQCSSTFLQPEETVAFPVALQAKQGNMPPSDHIIIVLRELFLMPRTVFYFILIKLKIVSLPVLSRVQLFVSLRSPSPAHTWPQSGRPPLSRWPSLTDGTRERKAVQPGFVHWTQLCFVCPPSSVPAFLEVAPKFVLYLHSRCIRR